MATQIAIQDRFEALAASALEELIEDVEKRNRVRVSDLEVALVPQDGHLEPPSVEVHVTVTPRL